MLLRYTLRRLLITVPLLLGISVLTFGILHLAPGSPVQSETAMNPRMSAESIRTLRELYGMDKPLHEQYLAWLRRLAHFDFGNSFKDQRPVIDKVMDALPATLLLNLPTLIFAFGIGIPLGIFSAARPGTKTEKLLTGFSFIAWSMPAFWLALMLQLLGGVWLGILPISGFSSMGSLDLGIWQKGLDIGWHLVLPLVVSSFGSWAVVSRYMRNSVVETLGQDYIRTAYAKGLDDRQVLLRHAMPNALLPQITQVGLAIGGLIGGSVIVETIFAWPGMGRLAWEAATGYDYPVLMGVAFMGAILTVFGNLAADLAYAALDPRIRY
ncbi:MAG: ABC transporter permease [candidate division FCPU426 bacterium]